MTRRDVITSPDQQKLKAAFGDLVAAAGGGDRAARYVDRRQQRLSDYEVRNTDAFAPIDVVAKLEAVTIDLPGAPHVTRALARQAGGEFVKVPSAAMSDGDWLAELGELTSDSADVAKALCTALSRGGMTALRARELDLLNECDRLVSIAVNIRARVERLS